MLARPKAPSAALGAIVTALLVGASCRAVAAGLGTTEQPRHDVAAEPIALQTVTVQLLTSGKAPRRPLRLAVPNGTLDLVDTTSGGTFKRRAPGSSRTTPIPVGVVESRMTVTSVTPAGGTDAVYAPFKRTTRRGLSAAEATSQAQLDQALSSVTLDVSFSARRQLTQASADLSALGSTSHAFAQLLPEQMMQLAVSNPFPVEAVGVGARWRVQYQDPGRNSVRITETYSLRSVDRDRYQLGIDRTEAIPIPADVPGYPPGTVRLVQSSSHTTGSLIGSVHHLLPLASTTTTVSHQRTRDTSAGQPVLIDTDTTSRTTTKAQTKQR